MNINELNELKSRLQAKRKKLEESEYYIPISLNLFSPIGSKEKLISFQEKEDTMQYVKELESLIENNLTSLELNNYDINKLVFDSDIGYLTKYNTYKILADDTINYDLIKNSINNQYQVLSFGLNKKKTTLDDNNSLNNELIEMDSTDNILNNSISGIVDIDIFKKYISLLGYNLIENKNKYQIEISLTKSNTPKK